MGNGSVGWNPLLLLLHLKETAAAIDVWNNRGNYYLSGVPFILTQLFNLTLYFLLVSEEVGTYFHFDQHRVNTCVCVATNTSGILLWAC